MSVLVMVQYESYVVTQGFFVCLFFKKGHYSLYSYYLYILNQTKINKVEVLLKTVCDNLLILFDTYTIEKR